MLRGKEKPNGLFIISSAKKFQSMVKKEKKNELWGEGEDKTEREKESGRETTGVCEA